MFGVFFWIILLIVVVGSITIFAHQKSVKKSVMVGLASLDDPDWSQSCASEKGGTGIAIDNENKRVALVTSTNCRVISYRDIIEAQVFEDGASIIKSSRASQIGGAALGGLLFGGAGAVVGALLPSKTMRDKVESISLRIVVNDISDPVHTLEFIAFPVKKGSSGYRNAIATARRWHDIAAVIIKQVSLETDTNRADQTLTVDPTKLAGSLKDGIEVKDESNKHEGSIRSDSTTDTVPEAGPDEFVVILVSAGKRKIHVIKVLRELTGIGLREAKDMVDGAPRTVEVSLSMENARLFKARLEAEGADVAVKPTTR
jgi:ribosomal protein L7/L12